MVMALQEAVAQRYRTDNDLGNTEMVRFVALKNGDIVEFNWEINSTREIKTIELKKGAMEEGTYRINWKTVKTLSKDDKKYIDYLPDLGQIYYRLTLTASDGTVMDYEPEFRVKNGDSKL
jgi:hypothetical protein